QHQRRLAELCDDISRRIRLAGARRAEQRLVRPAVVEAGDQLLDGLRLIAGGLKFAGKLKISCHFLPHFRFIVANCTCSAPTVTKGRTFSSVFGPIPLTRRRSSTDANGFFCRAATMASASLGPMPGRRFSSSVLARLRSSGASSPVSFFLTT